VNFFLFFGPIRFASAQLTLSPPFPLPGVASHSANIVTPLHHVTLPFQGAKTSSLPLLHLPAMLPPVTTPLEPLNSHHRCRPPSPDSLTLIIHWYKKVISTLTIPLTTQLYLYFASSLVRAPCHRSSIPCCYSFSQPSHAYYLSAQRHP
jgi:hypothetical protein